MSDMTEPTPSVHIDPFERAWMIVSVITLTGFFIAITIAGFAGGIQVPSPEQRVDPNTVAESGPFAEPGLREISPGKYEAYMRVEAWVFIPNRIEIPAGSEITFYITSVDVLHGFKLEGTNANVMVIPGQVSTVTATFDEPGDYTYVCHEYCGAGHAAMFGTVTVTP